MASYSGWSQFQQPLPPGWEAKYDARIGRYYFINHSTKQTTWQDPRTRQPEAIPLQNLERPPRRAGGQPQQQSDSRLETSFGGSSSEGRSHAEPSTSFIPEDKEEDFPIDTGFLASMLNEKSESDKENVARKLKQEFPDVDDVVLDVALRTAKHDEETARKLLRKLKGVDDYKKPSTQKKEEPKKKPTVQKKEEPKKKQPPKKNEEPTEVKVNATTIGPARKSSSADKPRSSTQELTGARKGVAEAKKKSSRVDPIGIRETDVKRFDKTGFADNFITSGSSSAIDKLVGPSSSGFTAFQLTSKPRKQSTLAVKTNQQQTRKVYAGRGKTFNSPLRIVPRGPDSSLHQGPNHTLLLPDWVQQQGPQHQNRMGPQRSNREGPTKRTTKKVSLYCGAQSSMRQGPMPNLVMGSMYAK